MAAAFVNALPKSSGLSRDTCLHSLAEFQEPGTFPCCEIFALLSGTNSLPLFKVSERVTEVLSHGLQDKVTYKKTVHFCSESLFRAFQIAQSPSSSCQPHGADHGADHR
jgi:hypothetical protein